MIVQQLQVTPIKQILAYTVVHFELGKSLNNLRNQNTWKSNNVLRQSSYLLCCSSTWRKFFFIG